MFLDPEFVRLHRISFVRASENTSRTVVFGALESKVDGLPRGASSRRRPWCIRPPPSHPAPPRIALRSRRPPRRCAPPRRVPPVVCPGFGFDNIGLHRISFALCFRRNVQDRMLLCPASRKREVMLRANRSVRPTHAPHLALTPRPAMPCSAEMAGSAIKWEQETSAQVAVIEL